MTVELAAEADATVETAGGAPPGNAATIDGKHGSLASRSMRRCATTAAAMMLRCRAGLMYVLVRLKKSNVVGRVWLVKKDDETEVEQAEWTLLMLLRLRHASQAQIGRIGARGALR